MREDKKRREWVTHRSGTRLGGGAGADDKRRRVREADEPPERQTRSTRREYHDYAEDLRREYEDAPTRDTRRPYDGERERGARPSRGIPREQRERADVRDGERKSAPTSHAPRHGDPDRTVHQLVPYILLCLAPFAALSFILRDVLDLEGSTGAFGSFFADFLCGLFGVVGYAVPLVMILLAVRWRRYVARGLLAKKLLLSTSFVFLLSGIIHVFKDANYAYPDMAGLYTGGMNFEGGGFFGGFVGEWLGYCLHLWGTCLIAIPLLLIIAIYLVDMTPHGVWERIGCRIKVASAKRAERREAMYDGEEPPRKPQRAQKKEQAEALPAAAHQSSAEQSLGWCQPRPLEESGAYRELETFTFSEEEDEPFTPGHATASEEEPRQAPEPPIPAQPVETVPETPDPEEVLREVAATEAVDPLPEFTAAQPEVQQPKGEVYAPFALPMRPFPSERRAEQAATPEIKRERVEPLTVPTSEPPREEILGAASAAQEIPVTRFSVSSEPQEPLAAVGGTPIAPFGALQPERESDTVSAAPGEAPVSPEVKEMPSPFTPVEPILPIVEEEPTEEPAPAEPPRSASTSTVTETPQTQGGFSLLHEETQPEPAPVLEQPAAKPQPEPPKPPVAPPVPKPAFPRPKPVKEPPKPVPEPEPPARPYCPPPISLLDEPRRDAGADHSAEIAEKTAILRETLENFHIHIKEQVEYSRGPTITRYEVRPEGGVSVRQFQNRVDDISMYMSAPVRIAPVPGKPAVGIEVPNTVRDMVHIRTMLESEQFRNSKKLLEVPLGLGIGGEYQFCDIASMPHLLIAGSTGSGKSVCINTILLSLIYKTTPEDLRLILIDPKQVEFTPYEHIPHLYMPIINDMQRASGALACAVQEMERRFSIMRDVETRDIARYNEKVKNDPEREHLPRIVIIIDEFAELKMNSNNNDPEVYACRIAQKARAAGIHLIIGTQRPSVDVITGVLKANIGSRIAFSVRSQIDSRTILDSVGAEMLAGKGDMLFAPSNSTEKNPRRIQGAFVSDEELGRVVDYVIRHNDPVRYNQAFMERIEMEVARAIKAEQKGDYDDADGDESGEDPKLIEAVQLAVETQKVATSLLQRRLGVGYGRAAKIIDRMEELGLVSAPDGNKPRKLLPAAQGYLDHIAGGAGEYAEEDGDVYE